MDSIEKGASTQHNTHTRSDAEGDSYVDILKVSGAAFLALSARTFGRKELDLCRRGGGISSEANDSCLGRSLACCALSLSWDEEGGGWREAIMTAARCGRKESENRRLIASIKG